MECMNCKNKVLIIGFAWSGNRYAALSELWLCHWSRRRTIEQKLPNKMFEVCICTMSLCTYIYVGHMWVFAYERLLNYSDIPQEAAQIMESTQPSPYWPDKVVICMAFSTRRYFRHINLGLISMQAFNETYVYVHIIFFFNPSEVVFATMHGWGPICKAWWKAHGVKQMLTSCVKLLHEELRYATTWTRCTM